MNDHHFATALHAAAWYLDNEPAMYAPTINDYDSSI